MLLAFLAVFFATFFVVFFATFFATFFAVFFGKTKFARPACALRGLGLEVLQQRFISVRARAVWAAVIVRGMVSFLVWCLLDRCRI